MIYLLLDHFRDWLFAHSVYRVFSVLDQHQFRVLAASLTAFLIVLFFARRTIGWLTRMKIGDAGLTDAHALRHHSAGKANTPTMGGLLIVGAIFGSVMLLADIREFYVVLSMVVMLWLAVLGGFDDWLKLTARTRGTGSRQGLRAWEKLVFQLGLGLLVGYYLYKRGVPGAEDMRHVLNLPFIKTYTTIEGEKADWLVYLPFGVFTVFAMLVVAGMSNAANITDGMDGLAAGTSAIIAVGLAVLTMVAGDQALAQYLRVPFIERSQELEVVAGAMGGACLGFLWWNCSPAQVFMGDTGSLALGGLIGYISVAIRQEFVVILMCGVFIMEIASVTLQVGYFKMSRGKRIFRCAPYHHHLHLGGWTEQQVVARAWIVTVLLVVIALATLKIR